MLLEGLQLPLTTPFFSDGRLNRPKLEHNVARYSKTPVAGLVALSDYGEPTMLSDEQTRQALRTVRETAAAEKVLVAGVSRDSVAGTLELAEYAATLGYDAVLLKQPSILRADGHNRMRELLAYFQTVADHLALPVVLSSRAENALPIETVIELAGHPQVIGLVDGIGDRERIDALRSGTADVRREVSVTTVFAAATGRMLKREDRNELISAGMLTDGGAALAAAPTKAAVKTRTKVVGFQILVGETSRMLEGLSAGAVGMMPGFAAAAPQACYEVLAAWKDGDQGLAQEKQERLRAVVARVERGLSVAGIKFGCDLNGYFGGQPCPPQLPLTRAEQSEVEMLMQGLRN
jgi:4-hydroxy-2-oxoglutarate aldolase